MGTNEHRRTKERRKGDRRSRGDRRKKQAVTSFPDRRSGRARRSRRDRRKVLTNLVQLERDVARLYADTASDVDNVQVAGVLKLLASESEAYARRLESRYVTLEVTKTIGQGVRGLLSLLSTRITELKENVNPIDVLQEGIEIEGRMERVYEELSESAEFEQKLGEALDKHHEETLKASEVFRAIAEDKRRHQEALQRLLSRMAEEGWSS